jgi:hypothetical protein
VIVSGYSDTAALWLAQNAAQLAELRLLLVAAMVVVFFAAGALLIRALA